MNKIQYLDKFMLNKKKVKGNGYSSNSDYMDLGGIIDFAYKGETVFISALKEQFKKKWHLSNIYTNEPIVALSKKLVTKTFADNVFFFFSGAKSNDSALNLSRIYAYKYFGAQKYIIISLKKYCHGRTCFYVKNKKKYYKGLGELGIIHADINDINSVRKIINHYTCAVIIEPIQIDGGINVATPYFVKQVYYLCHKYNALLIFDEINCGIGRIGKLFAYMHYNINPDIVCTSIGNVFVSYALLTTNKIGKGFCVHRHRSTNGGINFNCAFGTRMLDVISKKEVLIGVNKKHQLLKSFLKRINLEFDFFKELRGIGLIIGIELKKDYINRAIEVVTVALEQSLLLLNTGKDVLRFAPSLIISTDEIEEGMKRLYKTIKLLNKNLKLC